MKIYRDPDAVWRDEDAQREAALKGLDAGEDVSEIGTSIILLHGKMHALNLLGTEIWKLCDDRTLDEIVAALQGNFDVDAEALRADVLSFIDYLKGLGVVHER